MANRPNGSRVLAKATIGGRVRYMRPKAGTAQLLGLEIPNTIPKGKRDSIIRGAKGTKSYTVKLTASRAVGGAQVKSVDLPVPAEVKVREMYQFLKGIEITAGMITPDGISYNWRNGGSSLIGGQPAGTLPPDLIDGLSNFVEGVTGSSPTELLLDTLTGGRGEEVQLLIDFGSNLLSSGN